MAHCQTLISCLHSLNSSGAVTLTVDCKPLCFSAHPFYDVTQIRVKALKKLILMSSSGSKAKGQKNVKESREVFIFKTFWT